MTFVQTFRAILVSGTKTVVRLAAQTDESVSALFYLEQPRRPLVEGLACETTRLGGRPWATGYSSTDIVVFVFVATFGRKPLGSVSKVVRTTICPGESIDAFASQRNVCRICVHLAVLKQRSFDIAWRTGRRRSLCEVAVCTSRHSCSSLFRTRRL